MSYEPFNLKKLKFLRLRGYNFASLQFFVLRGGGGWRKVQMICSAAQYYKMSTNLSCHHFWFLTGGGAVKWSLEMYLQHLAQFEIGLSVLESELELWKIIERIIPALLDFVFSRVFLLWPKSLACQILENQFVFNNSVQLLHLIFICYSLVSFHALFYRIFLIMRQQRK